MRARAAAAAKPVTEQRLRDLGAAEALQEAVVVASDGTPGDGQTIASQGIVHSGLKYALGGSLTAASERIADMPDYWRACLRGETDIDLRATRVTSEQFYMMADASVTSRVTAFFGGQLTAGRSRSLSRADFPGTLRSGTFRGSVFEMSDFVLDARSLLETLGHGLTILEGRASPTVSDGAVTALQLSSGDTASDSPVATGEMWHGEQVGPREKSTAGL